MPPPGSYEVAKSYQLSQLGTEKTKPRTDEAKRKHGSFMSAASRFAPPRDMVNSNTEADFPGQIPISAYQIDPFTKHLTVMLSLYFACNIF
jgi:hypothetical protein